MLSELEECIPDKSGDVEQTMEAKELGKLLNRFLGTLEVSDRYTTRQVKYRLEKLRMELKRTMEKEGICP